MTFFLPLNSTSLSHYFSCACIKPARCFDNKPSDIQDKFPNYLLISSELGTRDMDCCLELVLTKEEENLLQQCGDKFFLLSIPLPISRVKKVYFRQQNKLVNTLTNINLGAAFIPYSLAEVATFSDIAINPESNIEISEGENYSKKIEKYNRILGALALMKTAKESYMNYSENYASTLSFFNALVRDDLERQGHQVSDKFFGLFSGSSSFSKFLPYLEKRITREELDKIASENNEIIERSFTKAINFDKLTPNTYIFAILQTYGVGDETATKKIDGLIIKNFDGIKDGMSEGIALYYGYNRGYTVFSNSYGTEEIGKQSVKYHLDSQLDYYTIESVYQFVFNSKTTSSVFPYIDEWCPKKLQFSKRKTDYKILDTVFIGKKKPSVFSKDYLQGLLAETKALDIINITLASFVDKIRNIVALDAKEEIEDSVDDRVSKVNAEWSEKINRAIAEVESLKEDLALRDERIDILNKEIERLKKIDTHLPSNVEGEDKLQQDLEKESESKLREPDINSLSKEDQQMSDNLGPIEDFPEDNKKKPRKSKNVSSKPKTEPKPTKRSKKKTSGEGTLDLPFE